MILKDKITKIRKTANFTNLSGEFIDITLPEKIDITDINGTLMIFIEEAIKDKDFFLYLGFPYHHLVFQKDKTFYFEFVFDSIKEHALIKKYERKFSDLYLFFDNIIDLYRIPEEERIFYSWSHVIEIFNYRDTVIFPELYIFVSFSSYVFILF